MYYRLPLHLLFKIILNTIVKIQNLNLEEEKEDYQRKNRFAAKELLIVVGG